jgi:hypothetical protein
MKTQQCPVCIENYNKTGHLQCICAYCKYSVCRGCIQQYLINIEEDAHCMNCRKKWSREQVDEFVSKTFRNNDLKKRRETILFEKEKALLPASQGEVQRVRKLKDIRAVKKQLEEEKKIIAAKYQELTNLIFESSREIWRLETYGSEAEFKNEKKLFAVHCPNGECRGFVNVNDWTCGTCNQKTCKDCYELLTEDNHECKEENIETAKMLKKETRNCPGCSTIIYKISGCNQMWCTQCHTTFNWRTGEIERGVVHNPHFYEWQQLAGSAAAQRNLGDVPCGGLPSIQQFNRAWMAFKEKYNIVRTPHDMTDQIVSKVFSMHRIASHIEHIEMPHYRVNLETDNIDLRVKYLMNEYTEDQFKHELQKREKKNHKKKEIYDVLEMYVFTMVDLFRNLIYELGTNYKEIDDIINWQTQVEQLQDFANVQFDKISKRYNGTSPVISVTEFRLKHY